MRLDNNNRPHKTYGSSSRAPVESIGEGVAIKDSEDNNEDDMGHNRDDDPTPMDDIVPSSGIDAHPPTIGDDAMFLRVQREPFRTCR